MSDKDATLLGPSSEPQRVAEAILRRAPQDLVFLMRFLGESQHLLQVHFRDHIAAGLAARGVTRERHPFLQAFIDSHATELREFVYTGMSLSRQFRIREIEELTGDSFQVLRMDIWDALVANIELAERRFAEEADALPALIASLEPSRAARGKGEGPGDDG